MGGRSLMLAGCLLAAVHGKALAQTPPSGEVHAVTGAVVYASPESAPIEDGVVLMRAGRIVAAGARAAVELPPGAITDTGYLTDYDPTQEYALMAAAGFGWRQILSSLTTAPSARFGEAPRRGKLEPGMDADLVLLSADPAVDPTAFASVKYTLRGGRLLHADGCAARRPATASLPN